MGVYTDTGWSYTNDGYKYSDIIAIVAAILILLGIVGLMILNFKLNEFEKNNLFLIVGALFTVGILIPIANVIGWVLMYIALGDSIKKRSATYLFPSSLFSV